MNEIKTSLVNLWQRTIQLSDFLQHPLVLIPKWKCLVGAGRISCRESGSPSTINLCMMKQSAWRTWMSCSYAPHIHSIAWLSRIAADVLEPDRHQAINNHFDNWTGTIPIRHHVTANKQAMFRRGQKVIYPVILCYCHIPVLCVAQFPHVLKARKTETAALVGEDRDPWLFLEDKL